jgi:hypothetical protein
MMRTRAEVEVGMVRFMVYLTTQRAIREPPERGDGCLFVSMVN